MMNRLLFTALALASTVAVCVSCGNGKKGIPGIEDFTVSVLKGRLYVAFVATRLQWDAGVTLPIPGLGDATVSLAPHLSSDGTVFQFQVGIRSIINDGKPLPYSGLPDGRFIPDVAGGEMPRWDFQIKQVTLSLYLSDDAFGVFIPLDLTGLTNMVSIFIEDEKGNRLGKAYAIPPAISEASKNMSGNGSGVLVLLPFVLKPFPITDKGEISHAS
jgi:hypothetical protein